MMPDAADPAEHSPSHWSRYSTDQLQQLFASLQAMEQGPSLTIAGVKTELERRRSEA